MSNEVENVENVENADNSVETAKPKKKIVFAKDRKQAVLAIVVMLAFFANSIYMIVKYLMEQQVS